MCNFLSVPSVAIKKIMSPKLLVLFFCVIAAASALNAPDLAKFKRDCKDGVVTPDYKLDFVSRNYHGNSKLA